MIKCLTKTNCCIAPLIVRLALGTVMLAHGAQKALGMFGGFGFEGTMGFFTQQLGVPYIFALLAIASEFLGSIGILVGLLTRVAALGIAVTMGVAIYMAHSQFFFIDWMGKQGGNGCEYHILAIGLALSLVVSGAGALSIDGFLSKKCEGGSAAGSCCKK